MNRELYQKVYSWLDIAADTYTSLPISLDHIGLADMVQQGNQFTLRFHFLGGGPHPVNSLVDGEVVDPAEIGAASNADITVLRLVVPLTFFTLLLFEHFHIDYISLSFDTGLQVGDSVSVGNTIGTVDDDHLEVAFYSRPENGSGVVVMDPATIVRLLALFSEDYYHLLRNAISQDASGRFGHARMLATYDQSTSVVRRLLRDTLLQESQMFGSLDLPPSAGVESRLSPLPVAVTTRTVFRSDFESLVAASPDRFVLRYIFDMHLYIAIFQADQYEVDLVDLHNVESFSSLTSSSLAYKAIINGPYYSLFVCPKVNAFSRGMNYLIAYSFSEKGKAKGHLKFRDQAARQDAECEGADDRYYFIQNADGSFAIENGVVPDLPQVAVGVDNLSGVIYGGVKLSGEFDYGAFKDKSPSQGMPFFGYLTASGVNYFVLAMRRDEFIVAIEPVHRVLTASFEEIADYLIELGAQHVIWTDGDDSVGMIVDNQVVVEPGWKKDGSMPLALGFRRV